MIKTTHLEILNDGTLLFETILSNISVRHCFFRILNDDEIFVKLG